MNSRHNIRGSASWLPLFRYEAMEMMRRIVVMVWVICWGVLSACGKPDDTTTPSQALAVGAAAPAFSLESVQGETVSRGDNLLLLSFLNTQADASASTPDPSRSQIVFLKSIAQQFGPDGLDVMIID